MNDKRNLVVLCQRCHDDVHAEKKEVGPVQMTSEGPIRMVIESPKEEDRKLKRGKWSEEEHETIVRMVRKYPRLALKAIKGKLYSDHGIDISEGVLGKVRKEL
jgi:hypothetical protein